MRQYALKSNLRHGGKFYRPGADISAEEGTALFEVLERMAARGDAEHIGGDQPVKKKSAQKGGEGSGGQSASSNPDPGPAAADDDADTGLTREGAIKLAMREADQKHFTKSGKPSVEQIMPAASKLLGEQVVLKADERDVLWAEVHKELSGD
ncbi:hypothetical protein [Pyruvatibacter sp.]|uniref:hypothetical protein n=1 Tax=Pyruvatibacter sp. TaxID=1981328 RepID=UPI0032EEC5B0